MHKRVYMKRGRANIRLAAPLLLRRHTDHEILY
jgi:hypothetical protein